MKVAKISPTSMTETARRGGVLIISGLSGAGKSTMAQLVTDHFTRVGKRVAICDGDTLREFFGGSLGYTIADRKMVAQVLAYVADNLARSGTNVIIASMLSQEGSREFFAERMDFTEVHLKTVVDKMISIDPRGVYKDNLSKDQPNIVGVDLKFSEPKNADLTLEAHGDDPNVMAEKIICLLKAKGAF